eukprot:6444026-Heterocapsa_arctica.AAC.1
MDPNDRGYHHNPQVWSGQGASEGSAGKGAKGGNPPGMMGKGEHSGQAWTPPGKRKAPQQQQHPQQQGGWNPYGQAPQQQQQPQQPQWGGQQQSQQPHWGGGHWSTAAWL